VSCALLQSVASDYAKLGYYQWVQISARNLVSGMGHYTAVLCLYPAPMRDVILPKLGKAFECR